MMKAAPTLRHSKWKKPVAERGWAEMQSGWRHEAFERKTPGFKYQVKEQNSEEPGKDFEHEKVVGGANARIDWSL